MKSDLLKLVVDDFGKTLNKNKYNQYIPKLRDYFIPFILDNKAHVPDVERLFSYEFTLGDITDATVYYIVKNENVESSAAVNDYLITLNQFFSEIIFNKYHNPSLAMRGSFTSVESEVFSKLQEKGISLREPESCPAIGRDDYPIFLSHLEEYGKSTMLKIERKCILKLLLLYGFSMDKLMTLEKDSFEEENHVLKVPVDSGYVFLELPHLLSNNIKEYLKLRGEDDRKYLFINRKGNQINSGFTDGVFKALFEQEPDLKTVPNRFTNTGIAKYAIINMILKGMNISIICEFTGQKSDILDDCQRTVNAIQQLKRNRYINHMVRGIETYDDV